MNPKIALKKTSVIVILIAVLFAGGMEWFFQKKVTNSTEFLDVCDQLRHSKLVANAVGDVTGIELHRLWTAYYFGTNGNSGKFNVTIKGSKGEENLLVSWHRKPQDKQATIDKMEPSVGSVF